MSNKQKKNKHQRTKRNNRTTTQGSRGNSSVFKHGKGKGGYKK